MRIHLGKRGRPQLALATAAVIGAAALVPISLPASGEEPDPLAGLTESSFAFQGEEGKLPNVDDRAGRLAPTAAQRDLASSLGADDARWNAFGTPHVLLNRQGYLSGPRAGSAREVARAFVAEHRALFRLDAAGVEALEVLTDTPLYDSPDLVRVREGRAPARPDVAHVVTFRQRFGDLVAGHDGLLTVGVQRDGRVAWVSSSVTGDSEVRGEQRLGAVAALTAAAEDVGLPLGDLTEVTDEAAAGPWRTFTSPLTRDLQRARLMALPTPQDGVRLAWETTLLKADHTDGDHAHPQAFISFVDAETGEVLVRDNRVDHLAQGSAAASVDVPAAAPGGVRTALAAAPSAAPFSGSTDDAGGCTPADARHPVSVPAGTGQVTVAAAVTLPNGLDDDITVNLYRAGGTAPVASQDLLTSPEVLTYAPDGGVPAGDYLVEVCEFTPAAGSIGYAGTVTTSEGSVSTDVQLPRWRVFLANPNLTDSAAPSEDTRELWCWVGGAEGCDRELRNDAARLPWDVLAPSIATLSTLGNNASTAISEVSFLTPDTVVQRPLTPSRVYDYPWENTWYESGCDPTTFDQPGGNDDDASTANLFAMHNRMHDWSYYLGFTELTSNLQVSNFGNTGPDRENDPELGNAQAGRRTFNGRDNANQITLQDGIAPITNQYLWQPLAGAFYAACTDGAYDMAVVAHEYGHAISNRMVAGPDTGTGSTQGQTESWSDLIFAEYFRGNAISTGPGASPFALAPYVSGNKERGIRNYSMDKSPLNYSDLEYDANGTTSPHADGEIWSAVNFDVAEALNARYDARFPSSDDALQRRCAAGALPADQCPGNRRWAQIMFDGLLLTPTGSTMLDSRDAMLAADRLRFDGANQEAMWRAFAARGMGGSASSTGPDDRQPVPGWSSPLSADEATVRFVTVGPDGRPVPATVYTGVYEARISPTADTDPASATSDTVAFVPGTYDFLVQAEGHGATRVRRTFAAGQDVVVEVPLQRNLASVHNGATVTGDGVNLTSLVDDTETTNWASLESAGTASEGKGEGRQVEGRQVTVRIGETPVAVDRVQVSAALRPTDASNADDPGAQSRFSALRSFDILVCDATVNGNTCTDDQSEFTIVHRSSADAFPGVRPRPTAPDLTLRGFDVTDVRATHVRIRVRDSQCTGGPLYSAEANPVNDPVFSNPDCDSLESTPDRQVLSPPFDQVRISELQVFGPAPAAVPTLTKGRTGPRRTR